MNLKEFCQSENIDYQELASAIQSNEKKLELASYQKYKNAVSYSQLLAESLGQKSLIHKIKDFKVTIGESSDLTTEQHHELENHIKNMIPWRKGPFNLFGHQIDSEWRSDLKWERVKKVTGPLQGKKILDIGCNNGYYLYLMAKQRPKFVLGIDPVPTYYQQFQFLKNFHHPKNIDYGLFGFEELKHFTKVFDVIFCMGIIYHHPDPIGVLKLIFNALRPGGLLIMESQGVNVEGSFFCFPKSRYAGMTAHWFLPSEKAHENIIRRSGFQYIETFYKTKLTSQEQRSTAYYPFETLADGLDPHNENLTIEGYPAPWRYYVKARRARKRK